MESVSAIRQFGQSCAHDEGFKGVVHLIAKYQDNLKEALIQSVMAGGDSAARGMIVGMILAAHIGDECLPENWRSGLVRESEILTLLNRIR
jgi:ADP-ribosylglycohydrolase